MLLVLVPYRCALEKFQKAQLKFSSVKSKYFFKAVPDVTHAVQWQSYDQVQVHFHIRIELLDNAFCFFKVLLAAYSQVRLLVHGLNADLKAKEAVGDTLP